MRSQHAQLHASDLPQTHLPGGSELCGFPRYAIIYFWCGSWSLSSPPCPHRLPPLHTNSLCIFLALSHSKKDQVSWQAGNSLESRLISSLGLLVFTQDWRGRGEKEESQGPLSSQPPLWALNGLVHMLRWGTRDADLPAPTPLLTPHFISPSAPVSPIRHLISGKSQLATDPIKLREVPRGLRGPNPDKCCPLPSSGSTWE